MITTGVMNAAAHVITLSVYGLDDAFSMVRLYAGSSVDGMTFGNSEANSSTTVAMTATQVRTKAQPSPLGPRQEDDADQCSSSSGYQNPRPPLAVASCVTKRIRRQQE